MSPTPPGGSPRGPGAGGHGHRSPGAIPFTVSDHLCIDFVNSRFTDHAGGGRVFDRLELEAWRKWFVERCGLPAPRPPDGPARRDLVELRSLLRGLLESGRAPDEAARAGLNRCLSQPWQSWDLAREGSDFRLRRRWSDAGWRAVMAVVAESFARLLVGGGLRRVRVCANPDCSFVFYDDSRNASRRWCDVAICGNLVKVRRHRARLAPKGAGRERGRGGSASRRDVPPQALSR